MSPLRKAFCILRYHGPRFVLARTGIAVRNRLGFARRTFRPRPWPSIRLEDILAPGVPTGPADYAAFKRRQPPPFLFDLGRPPAVPPNIAAALSARPQALPERLALLAEGRCVCFFRRPTKGPVDWHANSFGDGVAPKDKPWFDIPDWHPAQGDARVLWEPSRAAWAIDLARARARGLDTDAPATFWRWLDGWMDACPPYLGFQWKCGQESSVRFVALALAFWSMADDPCCTPDRWLQFARLGWATGYRVAHHIGYAVSQKNNHALSEACGLLLISQLFPEFRDAPRWQDLGRRVMETELRRQLYDDGSYLQQSMNYHRVMMQVSILALRLAELAGRPFDRDFYDRLGRCGEFVFQMMDSVAGRVPNLGNNDGAWVLPLSECDFSDYRPLVQAAHYLVQRRRLLAPGPWDEELLWLFGPQALESPLDPPREPQSSAFDVGGYYTLRRTNSWAFVRCNTYRDRPGQCDPLHLDLWWRGANVLQDCGLYQYYVPGRPDLAEHFRSIAAHNTMQLDRADPMTLVSRFMWFPWLRSRRRRFEPDRPDAACFEGEHYGYDRAPWRVLHRRTVVALDDEIWVIVDDLLGHGTHEAVLRWHMLDAPCELDAARCRVTLRTAAGEASLAVAAWPAAPLSVEIIRGRDEPGRVQGFAAPCYTDLQPIPVLEATWRCGLPLRALTVFAPGVAWTECVQAERDRPQVWSVLSAGRHRRIELYEPSRGAPAVFAGCSPGDG